MEPAAPGDVNNPATFSKATNAMAATWVESSGTYNLLNYGVTSTVDAIAGPTITQYTTSVEFDDNYNRVASITALGFRHESTFDERDLTHTSTAAAGVGGNVTGTYTSNYDLNGNVTQSFDALNNVNTYQYDGFDRTSRVTDPFGNYSESIYDANSNAIESRFFGKIGFVFTLLNHSKSTLDELDRGFKSEVMAKDMNGANIGDGWRTSTTLLDKNSRTVTRTDDNGVTTNFEYDSANRTIKTTDAVGNITEPTYNLESVVLETTYNEFNDITLGLEESHSSISIDYLNRTIKSRDQRYNAGTRDTEREVTYDGWSRAVKSLDAADTVRSTEYDLLSRTTTTISRPETANGQWIVQHFEYDKDSRTTKKIIFNDGITALIGQETSYGHDQRNRMTQLTRPDGDVWTHTYDVQSNHTGWTDPLGTTVVDTFNARNEIQTRNITRGTNIKGATFEQYVWDSLSRLHSATNYEDRGNGLEVISTQGWVYNTLNLPENHYQQVRNSRNEMLLGLNGHTSGATYDALGLTKTTVYDDGRTIGHYYDAINRVSKTRDETNAIDTATYKYAGSRLIERVNGNGSKTSFSYEASGCGCGGFSAYVENVTHEDANGNVLFSSDRRYDVVGNVTLERKGHQGGPGEVYRFDNTYRLTDEYWGVDISGPYIDTYANTANTPTAYSFNKHYNLDTRGNRTSVVDTTSGGNIIKNTTYNADASTNVYNSIDGQTFVYDDAEQMTFDPTTGLHHAYDYKGQLIESDDDAGFPSPERRYGYDTHGRLRVEEEWTNSTHTMQSSTAMCMSCSKPPCGCSGSGKIPPLEEIESAASASPNPAVPATPKVIKQYAMVKDGSSGGSSLYISPQAGTGVLPGGTVQENQIGLVCLDWDADGTIDDWIYHDRNQRGDLQGTTDADGERQTEYDFGKYGEVYCKNIMADLTPDDVSSTTDLNGSVSIVLLSGSEVPANADGAVVRAVVDGPPVGSGIVTSVSLDGLTVVIEDETGEVYNAMNTGGMLTIWNNHVGSVSGGANTGGKWSSTSYDTISDTTTLTHNGQTFAAYTVGFAVQINIDVPVYNTVTGVNANSITVAGDVRELATIVVTGEECYFDEELGKEVCVPIEYDSTSTYCIITPSGVNPETGATETDSSVSSSRYPWGGGRYMPPIVGFDIGGGVIEGAQPGNNKSGQHQMHNRIYDINTGRWTSPDPAASPWSNLNSYVGQNPISRSDPSGLNPAAAAGAAGLGLRAVIGAALAAASIWCLLDSDCRAAVVSAATKAWKAGRRVAKKILPKKAPLRRMPSSLSGFLKLGGNIPRPCCRFIDFFAGLTCACVSDSTPCKLNSIRALLLQNHAS